MTEAIEVANASPSTNHINDLRPFKGWAIFVATLCLMVRPCDRATPFIASSSDMHDGLVMLSRRNLSSASTSGWRLVACPFGPWPAQLLHDLFTPQPVRKVIGVRGRGSRLKSTVKPTRPV